MFVLWILVIVAVYYFFKKRNSIDYGRKNESDAQEILKKRYVNGDIDEETYLRMKKEIS
ncbi:MAG: SHOCT domain-containing protein [Lachnospiraceae bacterium]|jgi:uncharacterized membrane protein|nr:SHOCT domain-containing protein [Lachnospiraceae bacterium]